MSNAVQNVSMSVTCYTNSYYRGFAMIKRLLSRGTTRPTRYYDPLKVALILLPSQGWILLKYATDLETHNSRSGARPDQHWYRTKDYSSPPKPTSAKAAPAKGNSGAKAGVVMAAVRAAFSAMVETMSAPRPGPVMRVGCFGSMRKNYD